MDFRKSFSKPFKKLKDKFPGGSRKRDGGSGGEDGRKGRGADVTDGEASLSNLNLHSEVSVEGAVESGPSREESNIGGKEAVLQVVGINPPTPTPLISHVGGPDSMWTTLFSVLPLIGPTDDVGNPVIPDQGQDVPGSGKGEPSATDENRFGLWMSTVSATAKLLLRAAKESADAFPPLKSVVGGLCFILDNYEVCTPSSYDIHDAHMYTPANKGKQASNGVIGTQDQGPLCLTL